MVDFVKQIIGGNNLFEYPGYVAYNYALLLIIDG